MILVALIIGACIGWMLHCVFAVASNADHIACADPAQSIHENGGNHYE